MSKKLLSIVIVISLVLCLSACSSDSFFSLDQGAAGLSEGVFAEYKNSFNFDSSKNNKEKSNTKNEDNNKKGANKKSGNNEKSSGGNIKLSPMRKEVADFLYNYMMEHYTEFKDGSLEDALAKMKNTGEQTDYNINIDLSKVKNKRDLVDLWTNEMIDESIKQTRNEEGFDSVENIKAQIDMMKQLGMDMGSANIKDNMTLDEALEIYVCSALKASFSFMSQLGSD